MKSIYLLSFTLLLQLNVLCSCKKNDSVKTPDLTLIEKVFITEENATANKAEISVTLSEASAGEVSLTYSTADGSAKAGQDYEAVTNGTLTFAPGETSKKIEIAIIPDENLEL